MVFFSPNILSGLGEFLGVIFIGNTSIQSILTQSCALCYFFAADSSQFPLNHRSKGQKTVSML